MGIKRKNYTYKVIIAVIVITILLSGCIDASTPNKNTDSTDEDLPHRPQTLNYSSAEKFSENSERKIIYSKRELEKSANDLINCSSFVKKSNSAYLSYVQCTGGVELSGGEHEDVASNVVYYVSNDSTKRSSSQNVTNKFNGQSDHVVSPGPGFWIVNFANSTQKISVTVGKSTKKSKNFRKNYSISATQSISQYGLPYKYGSSHQMTVRNPNKIIKHTYKPQKVEKLFIQNTIIYILPDNNIKVVMIPSNAV